MKKNSIPCRKKMNRESRLRSAKDSGWVSKYEGKNIIKGFSKWFGVDLITSVIELRMLGVQIDSAREAQIRASVESRAESRRRSREVQAEQEPFDELYTDFEDTFETMDRVLTKIPNRPNDMTSSDLPALTDSIQAGLRCDHPTVWLFLLRALASGQPVSRTYIASALMMSSHDVQTALNTFADIVYDDAGDIVACGLSLLPTPHCFKINNKELYTWCALDTLMYPVALDLTAQIESHCPVTGVAVRLTVTPTGISQVSPDGVVVSIVMPTDQTGCCNVRNSFCSQVHFISSARAAASWQSNHSDATILSVEEAWQLGYAIAQRRIEGAA